MSKLKVGVFGGGRGFTMIDQLLKSQEAEVVAICDLYKPLLDRAQKAADDAGMNVTCYTNFDDFFNHDMDAVVLANYANEHAPYAIKLLNSGRHVMSECLTCSTMKEAVELIEAVERSGKVYTYAENYIYTPVRWEMRKRYRKGDIGEAIYAEGEYIHDCSDAWPQLSRGERTHWRNENCSTFYCTHSIAPILSITGLRPIKVSGFESQNAQYYRNLGASWGTIGLELITLENGAVFKSAHGGIKRIGAENYYVSGELGVMRDLGNGNISIYSSGNTTSPTTETYVPETTVLEAAGSGHGGGDFYTTYYFIRSILGDDEAKQNAIDVYQAVDMCIPGILAYKSIWNNNIAIDVPNLRNPEERDAYRNDTFCSFPKIAGDQWVPNHSRDNEPIPDSVYERMQKLWLNK